MDLEKFELRYPSLQNAIDIFGGRWASDLSRVCSVAGTGGADLFVGDPRPAMAAKAFRPETLRLDGMHILELGPLEAGHSFQLEKLGAEYVLAVEANVEAFLKCLVVKELLDLKKCHFMLGDVVEFVTKTNEKFDMVFSSGILYHMKDPITLIAAICSITDQCFVWTHYYDNESGNKEGPRRKIRVSRQGFDADYFELEYNNMQEGTFWGGNTNIRAWMTKEGIMDSFRHFGLERVTVIQDTPGHPHGACMSFVAQRRGPTG
jgi:hypothetical protein